MSVAADESLSEEEVEDQQEAAQEDKSSPNKSSSKIPAAGEIIEGKRAKKTVERLDFQAPKQKEKLKIGDGSGDKLGDIPRTCLKITKMKTADLKPLHAILFDRPGKTAILKKNLRLFNGFPFAADSEEFTKKREKLLKNSNFTNTKLKVVCGVLDLEKKGTHSDLVDRILTFLTEPKNSGKRLPVKKKRKSKKRLSGDDSKASAKKSKPKIRSSSSSPKKTKAGSKSKAIVMDSSSDEDDEEEEEKAATTSADDEEEEKAATTSADDEEEEKAAKESETEEKPSEEREDQSDKSEESEEEESPKSKPARGKSTPKKSAPVKRQRTPAKKTSPPKKRAKKEASDESDADSEADEKPKKKAAKPAAKTKKADSSSNIKTNTNIGNSSDDDEPLIKMIKKAPSDEQLKETVQSLLKEADLEQMTMKQICQRVFDTYPEHNLANKKDYIKQTVKSLIT
ncbi:protein DEK isoform X2 [Gymnodraco acuticeps]|uniref:Protein DEK isoform X2 n=1 Tax=Gymnodraco acuticeps TaxID=8218 RepID=A0A6P8V8Z4_GYMAC|nr:protein DEK isoform X2 [Gymnodraco acuticeps]